MQGLKESGSMRDETMIKIDETQEPPQLTDVGQVGEIANGGDQRLEGRMPEALIEWPRKSI